MRTIPKSQLPPYQHLSVIKCKERTHYHRMATSLESTLARCNEMYTEYESHTMILRENCQKEGFSVGFELFLSQLIQFLNLYENKQNTLLKCYRDKLLTSIKESFNDTVIVERIIHNLQVQCGQQKPLRIIIPKSVKFPIDADTTNYILSNDNYITIQNELDSIRFPIDSVCHQWITEADNEVLPLNNEMATLTPGFIAKMSPSNLE